MRRLLPLLGLALLAACERPAPSSLDRSPLLKSDEHERGDDDRKPIDIAVIGDVPYGDEARAAFPSFIDALNGADNVSLVVYVGDIKSGSDLCSDAIFQGVAEQFRRLTDPLVYAIGDNEWTDCHRANNGGYNPLGGDLRRAPHHRLQQRTRTLDAATR